MFYLLQPGIYFCASLPLPPPPHPTLEPLVVYTPAFSLCCQASLFVTQVEAPAFPTDEGPWDT